MMAGIKLYQLLYHLYGFKYNFCEFSVNMHNTYTMRGNGIYCTHIWSSLWAVEMWQNYREKCYAFVSIVNLRVGMYFSE